MLADLIFWLVFAVLFCILVEADIYNWYTKRRR